MKTFVGQVLLGVGLLLAAICAQAQDANAYTLGSGDVVSIHVFDEPELTIEKATINDSGKIQFAFGIEVQAIGRTVAQVQQAITSALTPDYLIDPRVTVSIIEYRPFFLAGEVMKPGSYEFKPGLTLRQAITIAGGFTDRASTSKMSVIPVGKTQQPEKADMNYLIKPGDTITIGESFF